MPNPWLERRVLAYAHQGGAREAPSSTLYAIDQALAAGADAIELDVHATRDGELVVFHDDTLEQMTDGSGRIAEHDWAELERLDNAFNFVPGKGAAPGGEGVLAYPLRGRAPADRSLRVVRLAEVLEAYPGVPLNLDVKESAPAVPPYEEALARLLGSHGRSDDVIVASFADASTDAFRELAPSVGTSPGAALLGRAGMALLAGRLPGEEVCAELRRHVAVQLPASYNGVEVVDEHLVGFAHDLGLAVHVWTVDDPAEMERLVALGVDGIMTDRPSVLAAVLARLGASWRRGDRANRHGPQPAPIRRLD
ncbi:MAG TPA: glycerophosphodiester phosphodiesterase [Acidimicrobiales bacterium]|nr:glycerophosphodiester phosphodiesterase [Acidimicrobiales bacterium]